MSYEDQGSHRSELCPHMKGGWTRQPPTKSGYYWVQFSGDGCNEAKIYRLISSGDWERMGCEEYEDCEAMLDDGALWWSVAIPPPP